MFYIGDRVAVLEDQKVAAIDKVEVIGKDFLRLEHGGIYRLDGEALNGSGKQIVPAMPEHFAAIRSKT